MSEKKLEFTQRKPNKQYDLGQWGTIAEMYRELRPQVTYHAFAGRIRKGMDPMTAATKSKDPRGRKPKQFS